GSLPVIIDARDGAHRGVVQYARSNTAPSAASASMCGVRAASSPYAPSACAAIWSAWITTMLGGVMMRHVLPRDYVRGESCECVLRSGSERADGRARHGT